MTQPALGRGSRQAHATCSAALVVGLLGCLFLVGCGTSSRSTAASTKAPAPHQPPPVCRPAAGMVIASHVGIGAARLTAKPATGGNAEPECHFRAPGVSVIVNVDSSPQPYQRLERTIDEAGQSFGTVRNFAPPVTVPKLGLDAAWLPDESELLTSDGKVLLIVTVRWRGKKPARQIALATLVARQYLGKSIAAGAVPTGEV